MSNPKAYTISRTYAIKTEYVAARVFLDKKHDGPEKMSLNDNNDYTLDKIGNHNVVTAISPVANTGYLLLQLLQKIC